MAFTDKINKDYNQDGNFNADDLKKFFEGGKNTKELRTASTAESLQKMPESQKKELQKVVLETLHGNCDDFAKAYKEREVIPTALISLAHALDTGKLLYYDAITKQKGIAGLNNGGVYSAAQYCEYLQDKIVTPVIPVTPTNGPTTGVNSPTTGVNSPTTGVNSPTTGVNNPTTGVNSPTTGVNSPTTGVNNPTTGVNSPSTGVNNPTTGVNNPTTGVNSPTTGVNSPTNNGTVNVTSEVISEPSRPEKTTESLDGVPEVITTGVKEVEDKERKEYLTTYVDKELKGVITTYFNKEGLGNNKSVENALTTTFLTNNLAKAEVEKKLADKGYNDTSKYYQDLLDQLINHPKMDGNRLVIPESVSFENNQVKINYPTTKKLINNPKLEKREREIDNYKAALKKLQENTNFLIDKTTDKVYKLGLTTVDTDVPVKTTTNKEGNETKETETIIENTTGQYNRELASKTDYYHSIQIEAEQTNSKISSLTKEYTDDLVTIKKDKSAIEAENKKLVNPNSKPLDKLNAQVSLISLNQHLLDTELHSLTTASLINMLSGDQTPGVMSQADITKRMEAIKNKINDNVTKMTTRLTDNEKSLTALNNIEINTGISQIKKAIAPDYVAKQTTEVDSLKTVSDTASKMFVKISKPYQESSKKIQEYESTKSYRTQKLGGLDKADPRYTSKSTEYKSAISGLEANITTEKNTQQGLITEVTNAAKTAKTDNEKSLRSGIKNGDKLYMPQYQASTELKSIANDNTRGEKLTTKESSIVSDIKTQTEGNKTLIDNNDKVIKETIKTTSSDIETTIKDIETDEKKVQDELQKAQNNEGYDLSSITGTQLKLLELYQTKQELTDKYNDTYYAGQINYQRDLQNTKVATDAHTEHTKQNVDRVSSQLQQVKEDIDKKKDYVVEIENQITELTKAGITNTDGDYKKYLDNETTRLTTLLNNTVLSLTGDATLIDPINRKKTVDNLNKYDVTCALPGSLYFRQQELQNKQTSESKEYTKWRLTQSYEQSRIDYVGAHAQYAIMKQKVEDYTKDLSKLFDQKKTFEDLVAKNNKEIQEKTKELQQQAGNTNEETKLNGRISDLQALNQSYNEQIKVLQERYSRLDKVLSTAKGDEQKMKDNMDSKLVIMNQAETAMKVDSTKINTDGNSTYIPVELDKEKMKYVPYSKKSETINENKPSSENISSDPTSKDTVAPTLEKKLEVSEFDTKFNEVKNKIKILPTIKEGDLKAAIQSLDDKSQEGFFKDPKAFWSVVANGTIDQKFNGNYGPSILGKLQKEKDSINQAYAMKVDTGSLITKEVKPTSTNIEQSNVSKSYTVEQLKLINPGDLPTVTSEFTGFGKTSDNAYQGSFKKGIYDGPGILYNQKGEIIAEGVWIDGKLNGKNEAQYIFESNQK